MPLKPSRCLTNRKLVEKILYVKEVALPWLISTVLELPFRILSFGQKKRAASGSEKLTGRRQTEQITAFCLMFS